MGSFADGFVTGLANKLSEGIDTRRETAQKYFEKQLEYAQTTGVKNRQKAQQMSQEALSSANKLMQMGVPKEVIMAQAKSNPTGLGEFASQIEQLNLETGGLSPDDFRNLYKVSGELGDTNEDMSTFINRVYDPLVRSVKEDREGFEVNPSGSLWSRMFATNEYGRATDKLRNTEVLDGYSAADLVAMGDDVVPQGDPNVTLTVDPASYKDVSRRADKEKELPYNTRALIRKDAEEQFGGILSELGQLSEFKITDGVDAAEVSKAHIDAAIDRTKESMGQGMGNSSETAFMEQSLEDLRRRKYAEAGISLEEEPQAASQEAVGAYEEGLGGPTTEMPEAPSKVPQDGSPAKTKNPVVRMDFYPGANVLEVVRKDGETRNFKISGPTESGKYIYEDEDGNTQEVDPATHQKNMSLVGK